MNAFVGLFFFTLIKRSSYLRKDFWDRHWVELLVELCIGSREPSKLKCLWHKFSTNSVESGDTSYSSNREEMEVASTKISTKTDKDSFSRAVFRSRLGQKIPKLFIPSHYVRQRFPSVCALEFHCSREISFVNKKLTFDEIISCITRHHNFSPRSHPIGSLQVAPFLRDCKGRGYRRDRRASQTERKTSKFIVISFKLISNRDC